MPTAAAVDAQRRPKMGFGVPLDHWFRHELRDFARDVLLDPATARPRLFSPRGRRATARRAPGGRFNHGYRLWALLVFELWHRQWVDGHGTGRADSRSRLSPRQAIAVRLQSADRHVRSIGLTGGLLADFAESDKMHEPGDVRDTATESHG